MRLVRAVDIRSPSTPGSPYGPGPCC